MSSDSSTTWQEVWERKGHIPPETRGDRLATAIAMDGFDSHGSGGVGPDDFRGLAAEVAAASGMAAGESVYEVGCGAGAFLASLDAAVPGMALAGSDLSRSMVESGRALFPTLDLRVGEAVGLPTRPTAHHVLSFSTFHYFPDHDYATVVIARMQARATRSVALLDLPDAMTRDDAERARRGDLGDREFAALYRGLEHRYYERAWVLAQFDPGAWDVTISDQSMAHYPNARFRFNVVAVRRQRPPGPLR